MIEIPKYIIDYWNSQESEYWYLSDSKFIKSIIIQKDKYYVSISNAKEWIKSFRPNAFNENSEKCREKVMYIYLKSTITSNKGNLL